MHYPCWHPIPFILPSNVLVVFPCIPFVTPCIVLFDIPSLSSPTIFLEVFPPHSSPHAFSWLTSHTFHPPIRRPRSLPISFIAPCIVLVDIPFHLFSHPYTPSFLPIPFIAPCIVLVDIPSLSSSHPSSCSLPIPFVAPCTVLLTSHPINLPMHCSCRHPIPSHLFSHPYPPSFLSIPFIVPYIVLFDIPSLSSSHPTSSLPIPFIALCIVPVDIPPLSTSHPLSRSHLSSYLSFIYRPNCLPNPYSSSFRTPRPSF